MTDRRQFLQHATALLATACLPALSHAKTQALRVRVRTKDSTTLRRWTDVAMQASVRATVECVDAFSLTDFRPELPTLKVPTLVLHGTADIPVLLALARATALGIPGAFPGGARQRDQDANGATANGNERTVLQQLIPVAVELERSKHDGVVAGCRRRLIRAVCHVVAYAETAMMLALRENRC